jgi:hypothetical protein
MDSQNCTVALKEWALTCLALERGEQVVLLRKGGILDEDGAFALEHDTFWLQPTYEHQSRSLVKPAYREWLAEAEAARLDGENRRFIKLQLLARVEGVFSLGPEDEGALERVHHIWSDEYVTLRYSFRPAYPLLCVALRVYRRPEPHLVPMQGSFTGCRSWLELPKPLDCAGCLSVLPDADFDTRLAELRSALPGGAVMGR